MIRPGSIADTRWLLAEHPTRDAGGLGLYPRLVHSLLHIVQMYTNRHRRIIWYI